MASKPKWLYQQSAVVPYFVDDGILKVVLITANSSRNWIIPKGVIERDMTPAQSAAKEALEEAGVTGNVSEVLLSEYEFEKWGGTCHVQVFPMEVSKVFDRWDEVDTRERKIVAAAEAVALVKPVLRDVLNRFILHHQSELA